MGDLARRELTVTPHPERVVVADRWVYAWRLPDDQGGIVVTCQHQHHLTAPDALVCDTRLYVETEPEGLVWTPLGVRPVIDDP
jgi:hypothetical protein